MDGNSVSGVGRGVLEGDEWLWGRRAVKRRCHGAERDALFFALITRCRYSEDASNREPPLTRHTKRYPRDSPTGLGPRNATPFLKLFSPEPVHFVPRPSSRPSLHTPGIEEAAGPPHHHHHTARGELRWGKVRCRYLRQLSRSSISYLKELDATQQDGIKSLNRSILDH